MIPAVHPSRRAGGQQGEFNGTTFDDTAATPIQNGGPPFFGSFKPQQSLVTALLNIGSAGTYQLQIKNNSSTNSGTLTSWSLTLQRRCQAPAWASRSPTRRQASFRIFTMDPTNPLVQQHLDGRRPGRRHQQPAATAGRPSARWRSTRPTPRATPSTSPAASGGIWKTTNFLTTTRRPDLHPADRLRPDLRHQHRLDRRLRPQQRPEPVDHHRRHRRRLRATVQQHQPRGVGFLRSMDGGATWTLLDSLDQRRRRAATRCPIASPQRDHMFVGSTIVQGRRRPQAHRARQRHHLRGRRRPRAAGRRHLAEPRQRPHLDS